MSPIKQILLAAAICIPLGLLLGMSFSWFEIIDPPPPPQSEQVIVWQGKMGDQKVVITREDIRD